MVFSLFETHSFLSILQQTKHKVLRKNVILAPHFLIELHLPLQNVLYRIGVILRLEGSVASDELVDSDSECPEVDTLVVTAPDINFRSEVQMGADDGEHVAALSPQEGLLGDAEVDQFHPL